MSLPRLECIAAAVVMRAFGQVPDPATPFDYERVLRPVYGLSYSVAQSELAQRATRPSERAWRAISGRSRSRGRVHSPARRRDRSRRVGDGVGHQPPPAFRLRADAHRGGDRRQRRRCRDRGLAERLGVGGDHLITGHTHRGGAQIGENDGKWALRGGGSLHNTGSWIFASAFHHPGTPPGPYWPGTVTWVEDDRPRRVRLLDDSPRDDLADVVERQRTRREP